MLLKKENLIDFKTESCTKLSLIRHGMLVMLSTLEGHRRTGYAKSCVAAAAKRMLSMGLKPMAGSAVRYFFLKKTTYFYPSPTKQIYNQGGQVDEAQISPT